MSGMSVGFCTSVGNILLFTQHLLVRARAGAGVLYILCHSVHMRVYCDGLRRSGAGRSKALVTEQKKVVKPVKCSVTPDNSGARLWRIILPVQEKFKKNKEKKSCVAHLK
jgi:hypothetical protein